MPNPTDIVNAQLRAYNARDIDAYCALFSQDATTIDANTGRVILTGIAAVREHYARRFAGAEALCCEVLGRLAAGSLVIDHEKVSGLADEPIETVAVYEVAAGLIRSIRFISPEGMPDIQQLPVCGLD